MEAKENLFGSPYSARGTALSLQAQSQGLGESILDLAEGIAEGFHSNDRLLHEETAQRGFNMRSYG